MKIRIILIAFLFYFFSSGIKGQTYNYRHYTPEDGLASSTVYVSIQDSKGYMWFGTENGVNRFDGHTFELFTTEDGLTDNDVLRIFEDSFGRIWFLTMNGRLSFFKDEKIHNEKTDPFLAEGFIKSGFYFADEDSKHRIWFCAYNANLFVLEGNHFKKISLPNYKADVGAGVSEDAEGKIHIFYGNSEFEYDEKNESLIKLNTFDFNMWQYYFRSGSGALYTNSTKGILRIENGTMDNGFKNRIPDPNLIDFFTATDEAGRVTYICTKRGVTVINSYSEKKTPHEILLADKWINSVTIDFEDNLWFMTRGDGVYVLPNQYRNSKIFREPVLRNEDIFSIARTNDGRFWISGSDNMFAYILHDTVFELKSPDGHFLAGRINSVSVDLKNTVWICSDYGLCSIKYDGKYYSGISKVNSKYRILNIDFNSKNEGVVTTALAVGVLDLSKNNTRSTIVPLNNSENKRTYYVFYDNSDRLFFSNIDGLNEKVNDSIINYASVDPLLSARIHCINQVADSTLILATDGDGVILFKNGKVTKQLTTKDGLSSNICRNIVVDKERVYVCTNKGLTEFVYANGKVSSMKIYNSQKELISNEVRDVEFDGNILYVATLDGLSIINREVNAIKLAPPPFYITAVNNNERSIQWSNPFTLSSKENTLTIRYRAISFSSPEELIYEYSFEKGDLNWQPIASSEIFIPNISPGKYNFSVRARKINSGWSKPQSFSFVVNPPIYRTWWFLTLAIVIAFGGLSLIVIYINKRRLQRKLLILERKNALNIERDRISADMHDDVGSDLSKIAVMAELIKITEHKDLPVIENAYKISDVVTEARKKLDDIIWALNPTNDTLTNLIAYINQYCLNFFDSTGINAEIKSNPDLPDLQLNARQRRNLFLTIKEIANNSLKHSKAKNFIIDFQKENDYLIIRISDDGVGFSKDNKREFASGLKNIMRRIQEIKGEISRESMPGEGTRFLISIPFNVVI